MSDATQQAQAADSNGGDGQQLDTGAQPSATEPQTTTDQATAQADTKAGDEQVESSDKGEPQGAPEKYELSAPEGSELPAENMQAFEEVARDLNLSNADAQKIIDKMAPAMQAHQAEVFKQTVAEWETSAKADKEYGGDQFDANLAVAKKGLEAFGTPELRQWFDQSGLGSHPEMIRFMYRAGKSVTEDRVLTGHQPGGAKDAPRDFKGQANALYPST